MSSKLDHYVSQAPFEPHADETLTPEQERFYRASQWQIMWWKFRRHRIAVISGVILLAFYASTLVSEFIAPYDLHTRDTNHIYAPPQRLHLFHDGSFDSLHRFFGFTVFVARPPQTINARDTGNPTALLGASPRKECGCRSWRSAGPGIAACLAL